MARGTFSAEASLLHPMISKRLRKTCSVHRTGKNWMHDSLKMNTLASYFSDLIQNMKVKAVFPFIAGQDLSLNMGLLHICGLHTPEEHFLLSGALVISSF